MLLMKPCKSYIIACTPRCGSHLLGEALTSTGSAGNPLESFPRFTHESIPRTAAERDILNFQPLPESEYDVKLDAEYVRGVIEKGTTPNGVFATDIKWAQLDDAVKRVRLYLGCDASPPNIPTHEMLELAFPNLRYIWLRRRDKIAQAVSWYKVVETGMFVKTKERSWKDCDTSQLQYSYDRIQTYWSALRSSENGWQTFFASNRLRPLELFYEDISLELARSVALIFDYLQIGRSSMRIAPSTHEKAGDEQSSRWIHRFKQERLSRLGQI